MGNFLVLLVALTAVQPVSADTMKHSGTVVSVDQPAGILVIDEVGPWRTQGGVTQLTRRSIVLTSTTTYRLYVRTRGRGPGEFPGGFFTFMLDRSDLQPGMFVTVDCRHEGPTLIGTDVNVVETPEP